jgi:hypothetical protein
MDKDTKADEAVPELVPGLGCGRSPLRDSLCSCRFGVGCWRAARGELVGG